MSNIMNELLTAINANREWLDAEDMHPEERKRRSNEVRELRHRLAHVILEAKNRDPESAVEVAR